MKEKLHEAIAKFDGISLEEMDGVKLMERVDTKYVFASRHLPSILDGMRSDYRLLGINNVCLHRYESLYYDTNHFALYAKHQSGRLNRYKIRFRRYLDSGNLTFFEIKFKNNKERTIKSRVKMKDIESGITEKAERFLRETTPFTPDLFMPKIWVNYSRMTFVNKFSKERLTIDTDLHFCKADASGQLTCSFPQMVIAEAKRDQASSISKFIRLVRQTGVREGSISKYCFGVYSLFPEIKGNNFKPKVRFIHKMSDLRFTETGT